MNAALHLPEAEIAQFCRRHKIRKLSIFGSALSDDFRPDSDVDVLVEFHPGEVPGFFRLVRMEDELASILGGREVDLLTREDLSPYFRDEAVSAAEVLYADEGPDAARTHA